MSYKHFNIYDRICIEEYLKKEYSINKIASLMKRAKSSISEEIRKYSTPHFGYIARIAQEKAEKVRKNSRYNYKITPRLKEYIVKKLELTWSPEQISNRLKLEFPEDKKMRISYKKIYSMIYSGELERISKTNLRRKGKPYNYGSKKRNIKNTTPMSERPKSIDNRENVGDWEIDTVKGKHGNKKCLATFADRKTRYYIAVLMPNGKAENFNKAANTIFRKESKNVVNSFNCDNGNEFVLHEMLTKQFNGAKVYFANLHSPWEKPTNENLNGLIREFFPKGTSFKKVTQKEVKRACELINNRPRKCLNWKTAKEVFEESIKTNTF